MASTQRQPLLDPTSSSSPVLPEYEATVGRWWVLFAFSLFSVTQSTTWFTFSTSGKRMKAYYAGHLDNTQIDVLLAYGMIVYVPAQLLLVWYQARHGHGIRNAFWAGCALCVSASVLRLVPSWLPASARRGEHGGQWLVFAHAGQVLNAAAGPIAMSLPSQLSAIWFPERQRATATSIGFMANSVGAALCFVLSPALIPNEESVPHLLYLTLGLSLASALAGLCFFPDAPDKYPSATAYEFWNNNTYGETFVSDWKAALRHRDLMLLLIIGGAQTGIWNAWVGLIDQIAEDVDITDTNAGLIGFCNAAAVIAGGVLAGPLLDTIFWRRFRLFLVATFVALMLSLGWFLLMLPTVIPGLSSALPRSLAKLCVAAGLAGLAQGAANPVYFELAAEISYPLPEEASGALFTSINNVAGLLVLLTAPSIPIGATNLIYFLSVFLLSGLILFIREEYRRLDAAKGPRG